MDRNARRNKEREEHVESTRAQLLARYPKAIHLETREAGSPYRGFTIDAQEVIAAAPEQIYWNDAMLFDIYRDSSGPRLTFRAISDHWLSLDCTDSQASQIRKTDPILARFTFIFVLTSASPLRVELRGSGHGSGDEASLSVVADEIDGRFYTGRLVDFAQLDEEEARETP
jgi:hypothetical protein